MGWIKAIDKIADGFKLARIIGDEKSFPAMFAPHVIAGADGKTYKKEDVEWFDTSEISFTMNDMACAYNHGKIHGFEKCSIGKTNESFKGFIKEKYGIDID